MLLENDDARTIFRLNPNNFVVRNIERREKKKIARNKRKIIGREKFGRVIFAL